MEKGDAQKSLAIINSSKTQAEAMERLKERFGGLTVFDINCWLALDKLPAGN